MAADVQVATRYWSRVVVGSVPTALRFLSFAGTVFIHADALRKDRPVSLRARGGSRGQEAIQPKAKVAGDSWARFGFMAIGTVRVRLLGYAGFEASERFLRSLEDEIMVARGCPGEDCGRADAQSGPTKILLARPRDLTSSAAMRGALGVPCDIAVLSAHASPDLPRIAGEHADIGRTRLYVSGMPVLGASRMVLLDTCHPKAMRDGLLQGHLQPGCQLVCLAPPREYNFGIYSVTSIAQVLRELFYQERVDLTPTVIRAVLDSVNAQSEAYNKRLARQGNRRPRLKSYSA